MFAYITVFATIALLSVGTDCSEQLRNQMKELERQIVEEEAKNTALSKELAALDEEMRSDLFRLQVHDDAMRSGIQDELDMLHVHRVNLSQRYSLEADLLKQQGEAELENNIQSQRLDLLEQDLEMMQRRRASGQDVKCQRFAKASLLSPRSGSFRSRKGDALVYSTFVKRLTTVLGYTKGLHDELLKEVEHKREMATKVKDNLTRKLAESSNDLVLARSAATSLQSEGSELEKTIEHIFLRNYELDKENERLQEKVRSVANQLKEYEEDRQCFRKLVESTLAKEFKEDTAKESTKTEESDEPTKSDLEPFPEPSPDEQITTEEPLSTLTPIIIDI